jgi:hypothetical protein
VGDYLPDTTQDELSICAALGARRAHLIWLPMRDRVVMAVVGVFFGGLLSIALTPQLRGFCMRSIRGLEHAGVRRRPAHSRRDMRLVPSGTASCASRSLDGIEIHSSARDEVPRSASAAG